MSGFSPVVEMALSDMTKDQRLAFESEYRRKKKNVIVMFFLTFLGLHFLFYGRVVLWLVYLLSFTVVIGIVWWFIELFMTGSRCRRHNDEVALNIARDIKMTSGHKQQFPQPIQVVTNVNTEQPQWRRIDEERRVAREIRQPVDRIEDHSETQER